MLRPAKLAGIACKACSFTVSGAGLYLLVVAVASAHQRQLCLACVTLCCEACLSKQPVQVVLSAAVEPCRAIPALYSMCHNNCSAKDHVVSSSSLLFLTLIHCCFVPPFLQVCSCLPSLASGGQTDQVSAPYEQQSGSPAAAAHHAALSSGLADALSTTASP